MPGLGASYLCFGLLSMLGPPVFYPFNFFFLKLSLSLSRYRSDRFGYRVVVIEVADLDKRYRIIVIEVGVKLSSAHHCSKYMSFFRELSKEHDGGSPMSVSFIVFPISALKCEKTWIFTENRRNLTFDLP